MVRVSDVFDVKYGVNLELNALKIDKHGINFVSRTAQNNGVSAKVEKIPGIEPIPAETISVAGGGSVMESFFQPEPYYSGRDLYYLTSKIPLSVQQKLFYCQCLRINKYRYSYGRQANRTLKDIEIPSPEKIPKWVDKFDLNYFENTSRPYTDGITFEINPVIWKNFIYKDLFKIERGRGPRRKNLDGTGSTPFVTSIDKNNGLTSYTSMPPVHKENTIGVNRNGSVAEAFYQPNPFCSTEDVHIFSPKFEMSIYVAMFLITLIKKEKYRFNYGRKWGIERMNSSIIKLPVKPDNTPDWEYMENYIKTLSFTSQL